MLPNLMLHSVTPKVSPEKSVNKVRLIKTGNQLFNVAALRKETKRAKGLHQSILRFLK